MQVSPMNKNASGEVRKTGDHAHFHRVDSNTFVWMPSAFVVAVADHFRSLFFFCFRHTTKHLEGMVHPQITPTVLQVELHPSPCGPVSP